MCSYYFIVPHQYSFDLNPSFFVHWYNEFVIANTIVQNVIVHLITCVPKVVERRNIIQNQLNGHRHFWTKKLNLRLNNLYTKKN